MKKIFLYFLISGLFISLNSKAQSNCQNNLQLAKNALLAIAGGDKSKNTSDFMVAKVLGLAGGCLDEYNKFNVYQQEIRSRLANGEKFTSNGFQAPTDSYKFLEERQKNMDALKAEAERTFGNSSYNSSRTSTYTPRSSSTTSSYRSPSRSDKALDLLKSFGSELEKTNAANRDREALRNVVTDPSKIGQQGSSYKGDPKAPAGWYNNDGQVRARQ